MCQSPGIVPVEGRREIGSSSGPVGLVGPVGPVGPVGLVDPEGSASCLSMGR
jgi:hypothetical protein